MKFNNRNVHISTKAIIGQNVRIGDNTVIYDNVEIGDNSIICNDCVLGEPLNAYYYDQEYQNPKTKIGANALIRSHSLLYAGSEFGVHFNTGHRVLIRENTIMGNHCSFGTQSVIQGNAVIGDYCRLHTNVLIASFSKVGSYVYIYPFVSFSFDPHPPSGLITAPTVGDFTQIAIHSVLLPGVNVGKMCLIGANTTVTKDVPDESIVVGNPGKIIGPVSKIKSREKPGQDHYPWVFNFEKGLPWEGIGYEQWQKDNLDHPSFRK